MSLRDALSLSPRRNPFGAAFLLATVAYLVLLAVPALLFAESIHAGPVTLYTHVLAPGLTRDLAKAQTRLAQSSINDPNLPQRFFLTHSHAEFAFFSVGSPHAFGITLPFLSNSFLAPSDSTVDLVRSDRSAFSERSLSSVLAHERTHALLAHHFGAFRILFTPLWKQEGYCDYIAGGSTAGTDTTGLRLLASDDAKLPAAIYFRNTLRVRLLLDAHHLTVDELFRNSFDTAALDREARTLYTPRVHSLTGN